MQTYVLKIPKKKIKIDEPRNLETQNEASLIS